MLGRTTNQALLPKETPLMNTLPALTSQRILNDTMALLQTYIPLQATGYRCQTAYGTALSDLAA